VSDFQSQLSRVCAAFLAATAAFGPDLLINDSPPTYPASDHTAALYEILNKAICDLEASESCTTNAKVFRQRLNSTLVDIQYLEEVKRCALNFKPMHRFATVFFRNVNPITCICIVIS
jgi:hypothetical protein